MLHYFEWLILALPLLGALINGFAGDKLPGRVQHRVALMTLVGAVLVMLPLLVGQILQPGLTGHPRALPWIKVWDGQRFLDAPLQIHVDALSTTTALATLGIGIALLSYAAPRLGPGGTKHLTLALLNSVIASLVLLILADNLLVFFLGWSLSGWGTHQLARQTQRRAPVAMVHSDNTEREVKQGLVWVRGQLLAYSWLSDLCLFVAVALASQYLASLSIDHLQAATPLGLLGQARPQEWVAPATLLVLSITVRATQFIRYVGSTKALAPGPIGVHALTWCLPSAYLFVRTLPIWQEASKRTLLLSWWSAASAVLTAMVALAIVTKLGRRPRPRFPAPQRLTALIERIARGSGLQDLYNQVAQAAASVGTATAEGTGMTTVDRILQKGEQLLGTGFPADEEWDRSAHLSTFFVLLGAGIILAYLLLQ